MSIADYIELINSSLRACREIESSVATLKKMPINDMVLNSIYIRTNLIGNLTKEIETYRLIVNDFKEKQKMYYAITARPSKLDHSAHTVCYFSTLEKAQSQLRPSSHDSDDNCTWYYAIDVVTNTNIDMSKLDRPPESYPYTGW